MKNVLEQIKEKAKALKKTIVLCEGEDPRVVKAAADATKEGIAKIVLLGNEEEIKKANPRRGPYGRYHRKSVDFRETCRLQRAPLRIARFQRNDARSGGKTSERRHVFRRDDAERRRRGRTCFRRVPFHGEHAAPRTSDYQNGARRFFGFLV